ncbi:MULTISPECIES: response regulator transcription factor [unclassified Methylophilus]|uniref:response regulator n=1 Tax=unclassified Methylophilus TaxID=2630143 RepID=UPI00188ED2E9|nr:MULTISPECIES: response regulator transcription factor [unclassified Methylophilus]MBF4989208.1 response regulator transcription factor [Methylophilus sp. 14]MBF4991276.1 response regulator transcription factor [Methylophilus sp. QUAN]
MKRILLVDDHSIVRDGLRNLIELETDLQVTGEASSGAEAIQLVRKNEYDAMVLDISMPDKNGVDTLHELKHVAPNLPVLVLSGYAEDQYALNLMRNGCKGYLTKNADSDEIILAIRTVSAGKRYISAELAELMTNELSHPSEKQLHETLSDREFQVFVKLATGQTPTAIADELFISIKTVSTYRSRILEKMAMKSNADLTYYAIKYGLLN